MEYLSETLACVSLDFNTFVGIDLSLLNEFLGVIFLNTLALTVLNKLMLP